MLRLRRYSIAAWVIQIGSLAVNLDRSSPWILVGAALAVGVALSAAVGLAVSHVSVRGHGSPSAQRVSPRQQQVETTLSGAAARVGFQPLTLGPYQSATLRHVIVGTAPGDGTLSVILDYTVAGQTLQLTEARDPNPAGPRIVNFKTPDPGATFPTHPHVETINGARCIFIVSQDQTRVFAVMWKSATGVDVNLVAPAGGLDLETARAMAGQVA